MDQSLKQKKIARKKEAMLTALEKTLGVVTQALKITGIPRSTYYRYLEEDKEFAASVDDIQNITIDFAESKLHQNISEGKETSIIFFLKTKGRDRGYVERWGVDVKKEEDSSLPIDLVTSSLDSILSRERAKFN